jgi:hypothetical protein
MFLPTTQKIRQKVNFCVVCFGCFCFCRSFVILFWLSRNVINTRSNAEVSAGALFFVVTAAYKCLGPRATTLTANTPGLLDNPASIEELVNHYDQREISGRF